MTLVDLLPLNGTSGSKIPIIGLGTWQAKDKEIYDAVTWALDLGYRHIDTAFNYNNEEAIGAAINDWISRGRGVREDLFITTKLPHIGNRPSDVEKFVDLSLERLKLSYIDLYLIHTPFGFLCDHETLSPLIDENGKYQLDKNTNNVATWGALEQQVAKGKIKNLGVSNFNSQQLLEVYNKASDVLPSVLQVELHAYLQQTELRELCKKLKMVVTAYSPIGSPGAQSHFLTKYQYKLDKYPDLLEQPIVKELSELYNKTPAQILLRHLVQNNIVVIPKSSNPHRIKENFDIFDFNIMQEHMEKLDALDRKEEGRIFNFLFWKGVEKHDQYPFAIKDDPIKGFLNVRTRCSSKEKNQSLREDVESLN